MNLIVTSMAYSDIEIIHHNFLKINIDKDKSILNLYFNEQKRGERVVWIAKDDNDITGYVTLKWKSEYRYFLESNIPEIIDLNVFPSYRNNGIGSSLIKLCEKKARGKVEYIGLGVGLGRNFGAAQRLYIKNGYIPDGNGITYNYEYVCFNQNVTIGDGVLLWLKKKILM